MAVLNVQQIAEKLNEAFAGGCRLVFWYDDKADFAEDIDSLVLAEGARVLKLEEDGQFQMKYFLERQDREGKYLIYAPFAKPPARENHLEDVLLYSRRFYADRASLLCADLGISSEYKPVLERHIKFFASKERSQRFYQLHAETYDEDVIVTAMMSALCRSKAISFEAVARTVLCGGLTANPYLAEFAKYDLTGAFWRQCSRYFDYGDDEPSLPKFAATLFVTAAARDMARDVPEPWKSFMSHKSGSIIAFLDSMKDNVRYEQQYDELADYVQEQLRAADVLRDWSEDAFADCDVFRLMDERIIAWITDRLRREDVGASLKGYAVPALCRRRRQLHFGRGRYGTVYDMLGLAWRIISSAHYDCPDDFAAVMEQYAKKDFAMDQTYRRFYQAWDSLGDAGPFEDVRELVERIYTNEYLGVLLPKWNKAVQSEGALASAPLQRRFYDRWVRANKERTVVIISDAMRYEAGQELYEKLRDDPNVKSKLSYMVSTVPSYTRLGMAALLPHRTLELTEDGRELADGIYCADLPSRRSVLQKAQRQSCCVRFDDVKNAKKEDLRRLLKEQKVVYMYHDQIDVRGEHAEDEVFTACSEAVQEIAGMIHRIFIYGCAYHFIVTADHGFIYKRDKVTESDTISGVRGAVMKRRYMIAPSAPDEPGIGCVRLGDVLGNGDDRAVLFPCGAQVFAVPGGGRNYVHGGSSPQEMIVPVIDVRMERGHMDTRNAVIAPVSTIGKVTNLNITLEFIQTEAVSDVVKERTYVIGFTDDKGELISQEQTYRADNRSEASKDRLFTRKFRFKNQRYDRRRKYYMVIRDKDSGAEIRRDDVIMDLAFSGDFGFDI